MYELKKLSLCVLFGLTGARLFGSVDDDAVPRTREEVNRELKEEHNKRVEQLLQFKKQEMESMLADMISLGFADNFVGEKFIMQFIADFSEYLHCIKKKEEYAFYISTTFIPQNQEDCAYPDMFRFEREVELFEQNVLKPLQYRIQLEKLKKAHLTFYVVIG